jgi:hypothetical protein
VARPEIPKWVSAARQQQATRPAGVLCGMGWGDQVPLNGSGTPYLELPPDTLPR